MRSIFRTEMFMHQSKANLDEKILFVKITHQLDPEIRKMLANVWDRGFHIPFWSMIYFILKSKFYF